MTFHSFLPVFGTEGGTCFSLRLHEKYVMLEVYFMANIEEISDPKGPNPGRFGLGGGSIFVKGPFKAKKGSLFLIKN